METAHRDSGKPVALVSARQGSGYDALAVSTTHKGLPVLDGIPAFLGGVRALFAYRDFQAWREPTPLPDVERRVARRWKSRLEAGATLDEHESLQLLADFGIGANVGCIVDEEVQLAQAAKRLGFPLVAKTAMPGALHKTEQRGVHLNLRSDNELLDAWRDLAARCGPRVLVAAMLDGGVEMILGAKRDPQFGPVVVVGFGGIYAELLRDFVVALPPFSAAWIRMRIAKLKLRPVLDGLRGRGPLDVDAFCDTAARFSVAVHVLQDVLEEADINPLLVSQSGCTALDALIVGRKVDQRQEL
jgi:acyl-CoA synthetase (NDP forming)